MILKASQRGGGKALAMHLLKTTENEHVEVHEVRGFISDDVTGAFKEAHAVSQGTRCRQYLFSVSLNPPEGENVRIEVFEAALARIEERNGLSGQPRVVVFHEKEGRRHCHAVWSRIDADQMKAVPLPHFKLKMRDLSREIFLEQGWKLPRGLMNSKERDPKNFTLAEWQKARRSGQDPRDAKAAIQECWAASDSKQAFERALESRGFYLARGDRRGHVAISYGGDAFSIARVVGRKAKEVQARLGDPDSLRSVDETKAYIASRVAPTMETLLRVADRERDAKLKPLHQRREVMRVAHQEERENLSAKQKERQESETRQRAERLRTGVRGLWDRITGERTKTLRQNHSEAMASLARDSEQHEVLRAAQLADRRRLQTEILAVRRKYAEHTCALHSEITRLREIRNAHRQATPSPTREFGEAATPHAPERSTVKAPEDRLSDLRQTRKPAARDRDFGRE